jgi:hypothetical protein
MRTLAALFLFLSAAYAQQIPIGPGAGSGGGGGGGSGTVTSIATSCQATGGTITTTGTISTSLTTSNTYTSSQNLQAGDACHQVIFNDASAATATLTNWAAGNYGRILNKGAGTLTLAAGTGAINVGCTSLAQNQSADIQFDGTNWNIACGVGGSSTITAGATATSGITSGDIIGSSGNLVVDTAIAYVNLATQSGTNAFSGINSFTGTATPTMAAGSLFMGGILTAPTLGANAEGAIYLNATNGLTVQAQGSTNGILLQNSSGGFCELVTNNNFWFCNGTITGPRLNMSLFSGGNVQSFFTNSSNAVGSISTVSIGNSTSTSEANLSLNAAANTAGNGSNSFTISNAAALFLQGGNINGLEITSAGLPIIVPSYTVGTLPTCNSAAHGALVRVTDATAPIYNGTLTGSGAVEVPAYCNGSAWTSH